ncbi:MAG: AAA family ATPase [Planctomycetaceae bacterium]
MRIQELEIDRFGVWKDVTLPLNSEGVSVFYGPNEAGKSTLMRFIRGVLYGYQDRDQWTPGPNPQRLECAGTLRLEHKGQTVHLRRISAPGTRGKLELNGQQASDSHPLLESIRGGASESLFQNVFAIGLHELQQLATLNGEEVAQHIYALSLGPDGKRILGAQSALSAEQERLIASAPNSGEIFDLIRELQKVEREIENITAPSQQHADIRSKQRLLEEKIDDYRREQDNLRQNLRGYEFLQRAWTPWKRERDLRRQLDQLPTFDIPPEVLDRFDELELEIEEVNGVRRRLADDIRRLKKEAAEIKTQPQIEEHACKIQSLHERSVKMRQIEQRLSDGSRVVEHIDVPEVDTLLRQIPGNWSLDQIKRANASSDKLRELLGLAHSYRSAIRSRVRMVKRYKKRASQLKKRQVELETLRRSLGSSSLEEYREKCDVRLRELRQLIALKQRREQLEHAMSLLSAPQAQRVVGHELPPFFSLVLWFFAVGGVLLMGCGLYSVAQGYTDIVSGEWTALLIGIIYGLMGISALALKHTMVQHFSSQEFRIVGSGTHQQSLQNELAQIDEEIGRLARRDILRSPIPGSSSIARSPEDAIEELNRHVAALEEIKDLESQVDRMRQSMSSMRQRMQGVQRAVSGRRRDWNEFLRKSGLEETLKIDPAINTFIQVAEAKTVWQQRQLGANHVDRDAEDLAEFRRDVESLGRALHGADYRVFDPYKILADWNAEVQKIAERRRQRAKLRKQAKLKYTESNKHGERLGRLQTQRTALLTRLGVTGRDEITDRLQTLEQRSALERQAHEIRDELHRLASTEPNLAIVDDHFAAFDAESNRQDISRANQRLESLDALSRNAHEELGTLRRELRAVEDNRQLTALRFDRAQLFAALKEATSQWCSSRMADDVVGMLRDRIEKTRQPDTLQQASQYLRQLTCGRYRKVWTRLGEKTLIIDDDQNQSLKVEQLSSGTREQVFLAIRLAMIEGLADQGVHLPLVLDDVTVNFDQTRTEAAVETLLDVATDGQQVLLFTCHLHLANIFQEEGIEPVFLPGNAMTTS